MIPTQNSVLRSMGTDTTMTAIPQAERLTVQREANDAHEALRRAHALLDMLTSAPSPQDNQSAALMPLGAAVSASRGEAVRLAERIDSLVQAVGQI